jgi:hypothetical protein
MGEKRDEVWVSVRETEGKMPVKDLGVHGSAILKSTYSNIYSTRCNFTQFIYTWKLLYMFRVVPPPIISSANNCIYSI